MKKKTSIIILVLLMIAVSLTGCSLSSQDTITQEEKEKQELERQKIELQNYAKSNGLNDAITSPFDDFNNEFTITLQSKYQGKYIVFYSAVSDIYKENGRNYLVLNQWLDDCILILECPDDILKSILDDLTYDSYAYGNEEVIVLASIETVRRMHYEIDASGGPENGYELYLENNNVTEIRGKCIAIKITKTESGEG